MIINRYDFKGTSAKVALNESEMKIEINADSGSDDGVTGLDVALSENPDFWPPEQYPGGAIQCAAPSQLREIAANLLAEGLSEAEVVGILGGNFRRVAELVWG